MAEIGESDVLGSSEDKGLGLEGRLRITFSYRPPYIGVSTAGKSGSRMFLVDLKLKTLFLPAGDRNLVFRESDESAVQSRLPKLGYVMPSKERDKKDELRAKSRAGESLLPPFQVGQLDSDPLQLLPRNIPDGSDDLLGLDFLNPRYHRSATSPKPRAGMSTRVPGQFDVVVGYRAGKQRGDRNHNDGAIGVNLIRRSDHNRGAVFGIDPIRIAHLRDDHDLAVV